MAISTGLVVLLASAALSLIAYSRTRNTLLTNADQDARSKAYLNARAVRLGLQGRPASVSTVLSELGTVGSTPLLLRNGLWFAGRTPSFVADVIPVSLREAAAEGRFTRQRFEIGGGPSIGVAVPLLGQDGRPEATYLEIFPLRDIDRTLRALAAALAVAAAVASLAGAFAGVLLARRLVHPLRQLAAAANRIASGDLRARLDPKADRALEPFIASFNSMASALEERRDADTRFASNVSHELRSPLAAMRNSLNSSCAARTRCPSGPPSEPGCWKSSSTASSAWCSTCSRSAGWTQEARTSRSISSTSASTSPRWCRSSPARRSPSRSAGTATPGSWSSTAAGSSGCWRTSSRTPAVTPAARSRSSSKPGGSVVHVHVDDRGPGVDEADRERIFERFTRGAHARHGTGSGLGLALVTEQLALMGGQVSVSNRPTGGARFTVTLPRTAS